MKRRLLSIICTILFICCFLTGCKKTCTVTIVSTPVEITNSQGTYAQFNPDKKYNKTFTIKVEQGGIVGSIDVSAPEYVTFRGWYPNEKYTGEPFRDGAGYSISGKPSGFDASVGIRYLNTPFPAPMTLYAKWERK